MKSGKAQRIWIVLDVGFSPNAGYQGTFEIRKGRCRGSGPEGKRRIGWHEGFIYRCCPEQELVCELTLSCFFVRVYTVHARVE